MESGSFLSYQMSLSRDRLHRLGLPSGAEVLRAIGEAEEEEQAAATIQRRLRSHQQHSSSAAASSSSLPGEEVVQHGDEYMYFGDPYASYDTYAQTAALMIQSNVRRQQAQTAGGHGAHTPSGRAGQY